MPNSLPTTPRGARPRTVLPLPIIGAFVVAAIAILAMGLVNFRMQEERSQAAVSMRRAMEVLQHLQGILSAVKDAETGQRGFLLVGTEPYLEPYLAARTALPEQFVQARRVMAGDEAQLNRLAALERQVSEKFAELDETVALRRGGRAEEAMAVVRSDRGKGLMDRIREAAQEIEREERTQSERRREQWAEAVQNSVTVSWVGSAILLLLIGSAAVMMSRDHRRREEENWVRVGHAGLGTALVGDLRIEQLGERATTYLSHYLDAQVGAFYAAEPDGSLRRVAGFGLDAADGPPPLVRPGEGLLGEAARSRQAMHVREVPDGHLAVRSSLGRSRSRELLLAPAVVDGRLQGVVELGFFRRLSPIDVAMLGQVGESLAMGMRASRDRSRLEELLEETQRQAEELQTQQEELRVSNEELEEQGRLLKESQAHLENQQAELEQSNAQLEEQALTLERQRDDLETAQGALTVRAEELERASTYKSQFLANMSHELRTPLNSTLILAKLLADNKEGNLTEAQVKFAQTISSAGNDLLHLINDILDLAKIEAGKMEVELQEVELRGLLQGLAQPFEAVARERGLALELSFGEGLPETITTDATRSGQVLKNLLSNALKFTEAGRVAVDVSNDPRQRAVRIAVSDTGIGIAPDQQQTIFEAFMQADGSTHRKYGGTGLGLAISRDLAHLLGGEIELKSRVGEGSTFVLTLPWEHPHAGDGPPASTPAATRPAAAVAERMAAPAAALLPTTMPNLRPRVQIEDDRNSLQEGKRTILVVEDDVHFAGILRDLAHEAGFQCVVAQAAGEGLDAARDLRPSAILLDVHLPDHSGLGVLDQLKRDPQTRHIPVHVVSVADHSHDALRMGAVGYAIKPVDREQLVHALQSLQDRLSRTLKRVLVVEDDERQRESICELLAHEGVEIVAVEKAADALRRLAESTFDCMVMDLRLPDMSGYELLERMSQEEGVAFPPVIVYTGRSLAKEEEQQLRRLSSSIIIKGARSPERLLSEVTLFLHQVETQLPSDRQRMLKEARSRESALEGRRILVVEDDVRNIFALSAVLEPKGVAVEIARNGREALEALARSAQSGPKAIDLVLMDIMMPEMDGYTAMREIRRKPEYKKLPIIALTAKAMPDDQEKCLAAGANDYIAKPLDIEKLLSLVRVWMPK